MLAEETTGMIGDNPLAAKVSLQFWLSLRSSFPAAAMPLVSHYRNVKMPLEKGGDPRLFWPLRAVGLAVEAAWKLARDAGEVTAEALQEVALSGQNLQILDDRVFRKVRACTLKLQEEDRQLANKIFHAQWQWLHDLKANPWFADQNFPAGCGCQGAFDLICYLAQGKKIGIQGRLWVELKTFAAASCKGSMAKAESFLKAGLEKVRGKDQTLGGVLLLVASVEDGKFKLLGRLLAHGPAKFTDIAPSGLRVAMGQKKITKKPPLGTVWAEMEWHKVKGKEVGILSNFLYALDLPYDHACDRADAMNEILKANRSKDKPLGKIEQVKIPHRPGPEPYVCGRDEFRVLYRHL